LESATGEIVVKAPDRDTANTIGDLKKWVGITLG
jgi:hypothetical protein